MKITKTVESPVFNGYRAARVRSMFNVAEETGSSHTVDVDLPIEGEKWQIGLIVGPSGTGKTTRPPASNWAWPDVEVWPWQDASVCRLRPFVSGFDD